jgi:hypothetical protein
MYRLFKTNIYYFVLSLFVQRKNQRKGAVSGLTSLNIKSSFVHVFVFWISNGLRKFWDKATVLKLAAKA